MVAVVNVTRRSSVAQRCVLAVSLGWRLRGLMFRREFAPFDGLWLAPTSDIHMFWVRFAIDLIWLDAELKVVAVTPEVRPWRLSSCRRASSVLELPLGALAASGTQVGDTLAFGQLSELLRPAGHRRG